MSMTKNCRICQSKELFEFIDFGDLALTGVFRESGLNVPFAPLRVMQCQECKLVQLGNGYDQQDLYGDSYGYESHLNSSMVEHLRQKARVLEAKFLRSIEKPVVLDIASNDGTLLSGYQGAQITKVGIDPLINLVTDCYPSNSIKISEFFSSAAYFNALKTPADLVTSLSVIYDLEDPVKFAQEVYEVLSNGGIWHFEQSYLPLMIETNSYDTICHEHLLYLTLTDIQRILSEAKLQILDASINHINGGSIAVTAIKSTMRVTTLPFVDYLLAIESSSGITDGSKIKLFASKFRDHASNLKSLLSRYQELGFDLYGLGASTKGNVLLQAAGIDRNLIAAIGEVNPRKFGKQTPGTAIPIVPEDLILSHANENTLLLVLPWHFRDNLLPKLEGFLGLGGKLLFPLPRIEIVSS